MDPATTGSVGRQLAIAVAAGATAATKSPGAAAVKDRYETLSRAITRTGDAIRLAAVEADPSSTEARAALAEDLETHGAAGDEELVTVAKELLSLITMDETARAGVGTLITDVEAALAALSAVEPVASSEPRVATAKVEAEKAATSAPAAKKLEAPKVDVPSSRRVIPEASHSRTEVERLALPIWKRTERFWMKLGLLVASYVILASTMWFFLRTPPSQNLEACRKGDKAKCWLHVATEDADHGKKVTAEPLQLLCDTHQDACGCAGLVYVNALETEGTADCGGFSSASALDPKWPCKCIHYDFWTPGQQRTSHCGIPRCD